MENFNKVLSFVLGLVVVVVFVVVLSGRLNLNLKNALTGKKTSTGKVSVTGAPTPTPITTAKKASPLGKQDNKDQATTTQSNQNSEPLKVSDDTPGWNDEEAATPTPTTVQKPTTQATASAQTKGGIKEIPSTGLPLGFIPAAFSTLFGGVYLSRAGRRKIS